MLRVFRLSVLSSISVWCIRGYASWSGLHLVTTTCLPVNITHVWGSFVRFSISPDVQTLTPWRSSGSADKVETTTVQPRRQLQTTAGGSLCFGIDRQSSAIHSGWWLPFFKIGSALLEVRVSTSEFGDVADSSVTGFFIIIFFLIPLLSFLVLCHLTWVLAVTRRRDCEYKNQPERRRNSD